jgi:hypothetical protein
MPIFIPRTHFWLIFPPFPLTNTEHFQFIFPLNLVLLFPSMDPELFIQHDTKVYDEPVLSAKSVMTIMFYVSVADETFLVPTTFREIIPFLQPDLAQFRNSKILIFVLFIFHRLILPPSFFLGGGGRGWVFEYPLTYYTVVIRRLYPGWHCTEQ